MVLTSNSQSRPQMAFFLFLILCGLPYSGYADDGLAKPPNILFVFADDFAFDCVGCLGNDEVETPNLDQLARQGTIFTHAYNMGAWGGAVCLASRAMLNTGKTVWRAHLNKADMKSQYLDQGKLWGQRMQSAGYQTFMTGKWHVSAPATDAFETARHIRPGMPNQTKEGYHRPQSRDDQSWSPSDTSKEGYWKGGKHWSEVVADDAVDFLDLAKEDDKPFFMYVAFNAPHDPRQAPQEFVDRYPPDSIRLPQPYLNKYPYALPMLTIRDEILAPIPRTPWAVRVNRAEYYAIITHLDVQIGRVLEHLKKTGQDENTYIVFTADHGLAVGHHGLMGKQNLYDHSMRVPFFVAGPDVPGDQKIDASIYLQDVMPTALELAKTDTEGVEFKSILPLLRGEKEATWDRIYGGYTKTQRCIVKDNFKLMVYPKLNAWLLFDLANDPFETTNLMMMPEHQERAEQLFSELVELQKEMGDSVLLERVKP